MQELKSFLHYITYEKRYSEHTIEAYHNDIQQFSDFISQEFGSLSYSLIGFSDVRAWIISLTEKKISETSINRKLISLRSFFKFLKREGMIKENPASKISLLKTKQNIPYFVNKKQIDSIFSIDSDESLSLLDFEALRDQVIFEVLYGCGLRRAELINLKTMDVFLKRDFIKVIGKRKKERIIPITTYLSNLIKLYIDKKKEWFTAKNQSNSPYLIINNKGLPLSPSFLYRKIQQLLLKVPFLEKKSPHILRHSYATHLLNNGASLGAVKDLLGHTNLTSTQVYTHNSLEQLQLVYNNTHPKA